MLRRAGLAVAAAIVLVVGGGGLAYALWSMSQPLPAVELSTGSFDLEAAWVSEPDLSDMFPGHTAQGTAEVTLDSPAAWRYAVDYDVAGGFADHLTARWYPNAQCTGTPVSPGGFGATFAAGDTTTFCIEFTLAADTPGSMQGQTADVTVLVTAEQVLS